MKVFWSWQSDTPGKTGRHFVRDVLIGVIEEIRSDTLVTEPNERDLELDQDRKGISGSPSLADLILKKIDACALFIADVTPVAELTRKNNNGGDETKKVMNPNVAIELGYAIRSKGDAFLMILNEAHGAREDLPFDLRHKAGPITYRLESDATKVDIDKQAKALAGKLKAAITEHVEYSRPKKRFEPAKVDEQTGFFFCPGESLAHVGEREFNDRVDLVFNWTSWLSLRLIPHAAHSPLFSRQELHRLVQQSRINPLSFDETGMHQSNKYGAIAFYPKSPSSDLLSSACQVFRSGEVWAFAGIKDVEWKGTKPIFAGYVEQAVRKSVSQYLEFMLNQLELAAPITCEFSATGLDEYTFVVGTNLNNAGYEFLDSEFSETASVSTWSNEAVDALVERLLTPLYDLAGARRPQS